MSRSNTPPSLPDSRCRARRNGDRSSRSRRRPCRRIFLGVSLVALIIGAGVVVTMDGDGLSDAELYQWWATSCRGYQRVIGNAVAQRPARGAAIVDLDNEALVTIYQQNQTQLRNAENALEALPFQHPTLHQRHGREEILEAHRQAIQAISAAPIPSAQQAHRMPDLYVSTHQLKNIYLIYGDQLTVGLTRLGTGSPAATKRIRALSECCPFL